MGDGFGSGPATATPATATFAAAIAAATVASSLAARKGSIAPAFYWQLIDAELAAESHQADTVILQAASAAVPGKSVESAIANRSARW